MHAINFTNLFNAVKWIANETSSFSENIISSLTHQYVLPGIFQMFESLNNTRILKEYNEF